ncbi:MAG: SoxR reducing system RseC family protein [Bacteroidaceae bacterium]|nr:SoxR reducing system RseC family protein [Bacteroidaceae bacterium]
MKSRIDHNGVVESIEGNHVKVKILQASACSACQAKAMCASADTKEKIIDVWDNHADSYRVGEQVVVYGSLSMGRNAVYLAFLIPLVLTIVWIVLSLRCFSMGELSAIAGVGVILLVYYLGLWAMNNRLSRTFSFWLKKKGEANIILNNQ